MLPIEHLDCPRHFLRKIYQLLSPKGYLLVTTPNIGHWAGRLRFLLQAEHRYFQESDYYQQRHISPISHLHLCLMFRETGYELIAYYTAGSFSGFLKQIVLSPIRLLFKAIFGFSTDGDANWYLVRKIDPDLSMKGRNSYYFPNPLKS